MNEKSSNPIVVSLETPNGSKGQSTTNLTAMEDLMVTMAYFQASEDSIIGAKQKGHIFKSRIQSV